MGRAASFAAIGLLIFAADPAEPQTACIPSASLPPSLAEQQGCHLVDFGITPLDDLGCGVYRGEPGGLYPGGARTAPPAHQQLGMAAAAGVVPRGPSGAADAAAGRIGFSSIGMSNTEDEFAVFASMSSADRWRNPKVVPVNGAQSGLGADVWANPNSNAWVVLDQRLALAGLTPEQLQVVWIKQGLRFPGSLGSRQHSDDLRDALEAIVRNAKARYPNLRIAYLSSRNRAYTSMSDALNPEPYAYETGFSVKWLIEDQIVGKATLRFASDGSGPAPWLAWGPYLWADGERPRSDGVTWSCSNVLADFTHPSRAGSDQVAGMLSGFLHTDPTASGWYETTPRYCGLVGPEMLAPVALARWLRRRRRRNDSLPDPNPDPGSATSP